MSEARSTGERVRHAASRAKHAAAFLARALSVVGATTAWTAFWLVVARFRWVQGATLSAGFMVVTLVVPVLVGALWYLAGFLGLDLALPVSTPDVDLSPTTE